MREGLLCVVGEGSRARVRSQTKDKLVSSEVMPIVQEIVGAKLADFLLEQPADAKIVAQDTSRPPARAKRRAKRES